MSNTAAAMRAAQEVDARTLSPDVFRRAKELFLLAKKEYKFKNFYLAKKYAIQARELAEEAELEAVKSGGNRHQINATTITTPAVESIEGTGGSAQNAPYPYPTASGIPAENYGDGKTEEKK